MKTCKSCDACKMLYRRWNCMFFKAKLYYCVDREEITETGNCCENWQRKKIIYDLSEKRFDEVEADIEYLLDNLNR